MENIVVRKIQCDNLGKNVAFQATAKEEGLGLNFEFTAHQTPQQMATSRESVPLCLEGSGQCLTWPDSLESMKICARACGPSVPRWQQRWRIWPPRSIRTCHLDNSISEIPCFLTLSTFLERLPLSMMHRGCAASWQIEENNACLSVIQMIMPGTPISCLTSRLVRSGNPEM